MKIFFERIELFSLMKKLSSVKCDVNINSKTNYLKNTFPFVYTSYLFSIEFDIPSSKSS